MFRRNPASLIRKIDCRVLSFSRRLMGLAYTQQLIRAIRVIGPTLVALSFAGVAHAQGTMDFSGATTLMGTFNVSTPAVQPEVVSANLFEVIAEKPVCSVDGQRKGVRQLQNCMKRRMFFGTEQVREQVLGNNLSPFMRHALPLVGRIALPEQVTEMNQSVCNFTTGDRFVHNE